MPCGDFWINLWIEAVVGREIGPIRAEMSEQKQEPPDLFYPPVAKVGLVSGIEKFDAGKFLSI